MIDAVITEDSDLLAYGVDKVMVKMDLSGEGKAIDLANLNTCPDFMMQGKEFTKEMLLQACIVSGCDYHQGVPGVGFKTALQYVKKHRGDVLSMCEDFAGRGKLQNSQEYYKNGYMPAFLTFKHQIVFDPAQRCERYLFEPTPDVKKQLGFLGKLKPDHIAIQIAEGKMNPNTLEDYEYSLNRFTLETDQNKSKLKSIIISN